MVSQDSPPMANQPHFQNQIFDPYITSTRGHNQMHQSHGELSNIHSLNERMSRSLDLVQAPSMGEEGRLSLSLSSDMLLPSVRFSKTPIISNLINPTYFTGGRENCSAFVGSPFSPSLGANSLAIFVSSSKYLKPAQLLLDEVVNVGGKDVNLANEKCVRRLLPNSRRGSLRIRSELKGELCGNNGVSSEYHQVQVRIMKLISLLEEVERRYEQYNHHLEEVISSFGMIASLGTGKSYTALALQAMSRHFCSLRDSITSQIIIAKRQISQDLRKSESGLSQLTLIDKENRQNRLPLQQIGIMQIPKQAWRPIRGLPETSVMILRSWLFEHFLHPYPNDSEKLMLASKTGLTKNQVSNWFINARVRLWKPMIEEMYKEEFTESSADSDSLLST